MIAAEGCKRFGGEKKQENARTQAHAPPSSSHLKNAIERAGAGEVWVKGASSDSSGGARNQPLTVIVASASFNRVLAAVRTSAEEQGFGTQIQITRTNRHGRAAEIRLTHGGETE